MYRRLTANRARGQFAIVFANRSCLWLADDHLLQVETNGFTEFYKRFYFRDIQTITFQQTNRYRWLTGITGGITLLFLLLTIVALPKVAPTQWAADEIGGGLVLGVITTIAGALMAVNLFRGPTCRCFLRTAVQIEELSSLSRVRRTRKILNQIRPLITAAQGQLAADEISARLREIINAPNPVQSLSPVAPSADPPAAA